MRLRHNESALARIGAESHAERSRWRSRCGATVLTVALAASVTGCTSIAVHSGVPVEDRATWKMPLDEFYAYSPELDNYAEQLLIAECVKSEDYDWPVPWQNTDYPQAEDFNSTGLKLFTVELAEKWGYSFAPPADGESTKLWREFVDVTDSYFPNAELDDALLRCTDEVRDEDKDFMLSFDGVNYLAGLALQAQQVALQDESVVQATERWRQCLEPRVDFTLPRISDPSTEMPPPSVRQRWDSDNGESSAPSTDEVAVAVADAECRESSGLSALRYEGEWEEQEKLVEQNRDKLDRIRVDAVERKKKLLTIVAENAPAAPR